MAAQRLFTGADEEATLSELLDSRGKEILDWWHKAGHITDTEYQSALDKDGRITGEAKNDIKAVLATQLFEGGVTGIARMFDNLPVKAQRALLATAWRDAQSPKGQKLKGDLQDAIVMYNHLMNQPLFQKGTSFEDVYSGAMQWYLNTQIDDTGAGGTFVPSEHYSRVSVVLASMMKSENQRHLQTLLGDIYRRVQGLPGEGLFDAEGSEPKALSAALEEVIKNEFNRTIKYDGRNGKSDVGGAGGASPEGGGVGLGGDNGGGEGEPPAGPAEPGGRGEGDGAADNDGRGGDGSIEQRQSNTTSSEEVDENGIPFVKAADGTTVFGEIREDSGLQPAPIRLSEGFQDADGKGYGLAHIEANHGEQIRDAGFASVEDFVAFVAKNYDEDNIRVGKRRDNGNTTYLIQVQDEHDNTLFIEMSRDGSYWNVNSAGIFRKGYSNKKETVAKTEPQQPNNAVSTGSSLSADEVSGITSTEPNGEPTVSVGEGSEKSATVQEETEKVAENQTPNAVQATLAAAEQETNTEPTEAQKEAGNYKKGHVKIDGYDVTIENPKGSVRRGTDASGKQWEQEMRNTYGYIRGTEGVDGDHIDVFFSEDPSQGDVFVVDQVNKEGSFDEHKVMYGFPDIESARKAYLSNYEDGWQGLGAITPVSKEEFKKWIDSSHRKTKPFAEYSSVKPLGDTQLGEQSAASYSIEPTTYTNKKGKTTPMHLVTFGRELSKDEIRAGKELAKESRGWWDREKGGFMMRDEASAKALAEALSNEEAVQDAQPLSVEDVATVTDQAEVETIDDAIDVEQEPQTTPQYDYDREDDVYDKTLTGLRNVLNDRKRGAIPNIKSIENVIRDLRKRAKTIEDGMATAAGETIPQAFDALADLNGKRRAFEQFLSDIRKKMAETERDDALAAHGVKLSDHIEEPQQEESTEQPKQEEKKTKSKWVDDADAERFEELSRRLRQKLGGQLNMGIDPEAFAIGVEMSYLMLKHGARKFAEFAKRMIKAQGEYVRPYLKSFYNGARDLPEMEEFEKELTPYDEVRAFDVMNFDKEGAKDIVATAKHIVREQSAEREAKEATDKLKQKRNEQRKEAEQEVAEKAGSQQEKPSKGRKSKKKSVSLQEQTIPDLFSGLIDTESNSVEPQKKNNDGLQRVHEVRSEGLSARGHQQREYPERRGETSGQESGRADRRGEGNSTRTSERPDRHGSQLDEVAVLPQHTERGAGNTKKPAKPEPAPLAESERKNTHNNHAERGTDYAPKGTSARIEANIKAIETMQRLIESGEPATPEDMAVLRKFSGWGGLGAAFKEKVSSGDSGYNPRLRDDSQPANPINARLRELLSPEAYEAANMSRNTAYYTPAPIIDAMWDVARAMGFRGGNVLEGSAGIGNIIGLMPADMSERSNIHAVEIDETTGNILSLLYPDANVEVKGFEKTFVPNGSVDLAITNVPFVTGLRVMDETGDKDLSRKFHDIHDFCIAKNVRKLKEGGVGIFITSSGTLDSPNSAKLRTWLVNEGGADVVGAFRMHNQTFGGTGATSDIIVIRKRVNGRKSANAIDVSGTLPIRTVKYNTGETKRGSSEMVIKDLALDVNKHFVEHPEDMAGEMAFAFEKGDTYRATSKALYPSPSINQEQRLSEWAQQFKDMDWDKAEERESQQVVYEDLGEDVKEGSMLLDSDGNLCLAQRGKAVPINVNANKVKGHTKAECFNAYKAIKDALDDVLEYQTTHSDDSGLQQRLAKLNKAYDSFVKTYGHLNKNTSISFLRSDMDYPSIAALESVKETGDKSGKRIVTYGKTDIFSRRVVETESEPKPTTIKDGIIASIYLNGRVDVPYIAEQLNISDSDVRQQIIESGLGFENPTTTEMEVSYEYLSGNVREKLRQAQENNTDGRYDANIKALERVIPMNIPAHLIEFTLGSSWVEPKLYEDFVKERTGLDVKLTNAGGTWIMSEPYYTNTEQNRAMGVISEKCDKTIYGHELIKAAITCKSISVTKTISTGYGSSKTTETIVDKEATMACANKIDEIRQDFKDWARGKMQGDPEMSERMERVYNELFNNSVPKEIPDDFVPEHFGGAATVVNGKPFKLRPHQAKAVIRATTQPLMLAHEVGTGKTYTLISTAMEMRRLGTARKPMIVVQNATVGQFVASAKALYPNAKILTLEDADRNAEGRRNFYAKIRYNDWDMIVVPQSVFEMIPDSEERQIRFKEEKVAEKMTVLEKMREAADNDRDPAVRRAERELEQLNNEINDLKLSLKERKSEKDEKREAKTKQNAMVKAEEMLDRKTDDVANFDDMGIDALLIDEAHEYKRLGFETAMTRGVKGIDPAYSKKSQGVYLKTQAVLENKNGKNVVFATGTPISNTAAEIWTFMRYLMPADTMREYGIYYFDDFVRNFGNIQQMLEFATNGKYKENNRFAGYVNLPELVRIWAGVADTVLTREAGGVSDKIPKMEGYKAQDIYLPQTKALRGVMKFVTDRLDEYEKMSGKEKKENSHIPLVMYGIAKAAAVDARLVLEDAADEPNSKTNEAVRQTLRSLEDTKEYNGTVAIFADNYQNKATGFNLYEDIRKKLIAAGVPEEQVVVMKPGMKIKQKFEIFDKVNRGEVRVIMGSTFTLGTGVNIQERLHTLIHVDAPNRPMDYTQRNGRILRQGNLHNEWGIPVRVLRFGVEDSLDVTAYQRLKTKGAIADSIMEGKKMMSNSMENRVLEEEQDLFGDITAQLSGSQYALLKNQVEKEVRKLEARKKQWEADQTYVHNQKPRLKALIKDSEERAKRNKEALARVEAAKNDGITIGKMKFPSLDAMGDYIKDYNSKQREQQEQVRTASEYKAEAVSDLTIKVGEFDFKLHRVISKEQKQERGQLSLTFVARTQMTYSCEALGLEDVPVEGQRLKSALEDIVEDVMTGNYFRERAEAAERVSARYKEELQQVEARDGKPFEYADELKQAKEKLAEYEELMKAEMAEKEAKYAEMDASVEAAKGVQLSDEDSDDVTGGGDVYRDPDETEEKLPLPWMPAWQRGAAERRVARLAELERGDGWIESDERREGDDGEERKVYVPRYEVRDTIDDEPQEGARRYESVAEALEELRERPDAEDGGFYEPMKEVYVTWDEKWVDADGYEVEDGREGLRGEEIDDCDAIVEEYGDGVEPLAYRTWTSRDAQRGATEEGVRSAAREQLDGLVIDVDGRKLRLDAREAFGKKYSTVKVIDEASGERVGEIQLRLADHSRNPGNDWRGGEDTRTVSVVLNSADPTEGRWHGGDLRYGEEADAERIVEDVRARIEEIVAGESWGEAEGGAVTATASPRTPTEGYGVDGRKIAIDDRAAQRKYLLSGAPVKLLAGEKIMSREGQSFTDAVAEMFFRQGGKAQSAFGEVLLDRKGVKNDINHGMGVDKNIAFAAVKDVLKKGAVVLPLDYYHTNGKKQQTGIIAAPITIDGKRYVCAVEVIANTENKRLYVHEVYATEKLQEDVASNQVRGSKTASPHPQGAIAKVLQEIVNAKYSDDVIEDTDRYRIREEADRAEMRSAVQRMGEKLHTPVNIIDDAASITHPDAGIQERRRKSKGWYDTATGEVYIVLDNNKDIDDAIATAAHETIAHKGLRELVGEERYGEFLDEVYRHLRDDLKKGVDDAAGRAFIDDTIKNGKRAKRYGHHRRTAVDELFGRLAEKPFDEMNGRERTLWQKLKATVRRLLDKFLGSLRLPKMFELGDNELRYMLWRSKERLERKGGVIETARDEAKRAELGLTDDARYNMGDGAGTFKARQRRAVENKGTVMPGLNDAQVKVVDVPRHPYKGSWVEAVEAAVNDAIEKYTRPGKDNDGKEIRVPIPQHYDNFGAEFDYGISRKSIEESINEEQIKKSLDGEASRGVHLAVLNHLDEVIGESIEIEEHPDYIKKEGKRKPENGTNENILVHRFVGAIKVDGKEYRVKTTMLEYKQADMASREYAYDVTKIEVLDDKTPNTPDDLDRAAKGLLPLAKVIKNVKKSYDSGKKILVESKIADVSGDLYRDPDETEDIWTDGSLGLDEQVTRAAVRLAGRHRESAAAKQAAYREIGGNLTKLRQAMALQKRFDRTTVKRVSDLARVLISGGYLSELSGGEVKRLLSAVKNSTGHNDIEADVQKVMDIMVDNQLKQGEAALRALEAMKGSKVDAIIFSSFASPL